MNKQVKYQPLIETQTKKTPHKYFCEHLTRVQVTSIQFGDLEITLHCIKGWTVNKFTISIDL